MGEMEPYLPSLLEVSTLANRRAEGRHEPNHELVVAAVSDMVHVRSSE